MPGTSSIDPIPLLHQPVILLGMHRSGTSLIARLLDDIGLFQGAEMQDDHESAWFLEINDLLLRRVNAYWDHPAPFKAFLQHEAGVDLAVRCLREDVCSRHVAGFLGTTRFFLKTRSLSKLNVPWGWKDPRTVFTLPLWLRLFPKARLLYIARNGVDVASSLRVRERRELERRIREFDGKRKKLASHLLTERATFKGSSRCLTLEGAFSLWEEYVAEAEAQLAACDNERLVVSYERLLADPTDAQHGLPRLASFCGLEGKGELLTKAVAQIKPERSAAFLSDPELKTFYAKVKDTTWMARYGYSQLGSPA